MLRLELKASSAGPGCAILSVTGWKQDSSNIELSVQRNQDSRFLDGNGDWTTNPVWHRVDMQDETDGTLSAEVGPWLVDPLVTNSTGTYMFELRNASHKDKGVLRIMGQILSSKAAGNSLSQEERVQPPSAPTPAPVVTAPPAPEPEPPAPVQIETPNDDVTVVVATTPEPTPPPPEPVPEPEPPTQIHASVAPAPTPIAPEKNRSKIGLWLGLLALLLIAAAGAAWYLGLFGSGDSQPVTASSEAGPCDQRNMGGGDDLAFVQACLKSSPTSEQILAVITAAKENKHCNIAQRLYAYKAQGGDARIALAYAREYDPDTFKAGGCIERADAETAAYWYEIVVNQQPDNAEARARLEALGSP